MKSFFQDHYQKWCKQSQVPFIINIIVRCFSLLVHERLGEGAEKLFLERIIMSCAP